MSSLNRQPAVHHSSMFLTSGCVNSGAWSFLSAMVIVAVAVPVRPTSLPAMSLATISNSYLVVGSVYKIQNMGVRLHIQTCTFNKTHRCNVWTQEEKYRKMKVMEVSFGRKASKKTITQKKNVSIKGCTRQNDKYSQGHLHILPRSLTRPNRDIYTFSQGHFRVLTLQVIPSTTVNNPP